MELELKTVATEGSNAGLQWLAGPDVGEPPAAGSANDLRVRVSNDATSKKESFGLVWTDDKAPPIPAYVPPGESRVVRVPRPAGATSRQALRLQGDTQEFDNVLYLASEARESVAVLYVGRDAPDDPAGLSYYLHRVFEDTPRRIVKVESRSPEAPLAIEPGRSVPLIVLAAETSATNVAFLRQFAMDGGTVLVVVTATGKAPTLSALAEAPSVELADPPGQGDAMLSEIAFDHPLFAAFAAPQFNDFTKIKFWKYRRIPMAQFGGFRVLARFEKGDPAAIEKTLGKGRLVILASGWSPADSQLARSSKFMPLMSALLDGPNAGPDLSATRLVQEQVPLPEGAVAVRKPDGSTVKVAPGTSTFSETDAPGVYTVETAKGPREFAVNLDPMESKTAPLNVETLEQFGCRLAMSALAHRGRTRGDAADAERGVGRPPEALATADPGGDLCLDRRDLAGGLARSSPSEPEGGPSIMSWQLRQALERVARRVREVRLWSSLALCWLAWTLVGALLAAAGVRSVVILAGYASPGAGLRPRLRRLRHAVGAGPPRGRPPHRGGASRPGRCPPDCRRGGPARLLRPTELPARGRCRQGARSRTLSRLGRHRPPEGHPWGQACPPGGSVRACRSLDCARGPGGL